jgi:protein SCO1/2
MTVAALVLALAIPAIDIVDDSGRVRSTAEWKGTPTILAPMYARCPLACPLIVKGLKRGVLESSAPPASYRVVVFSFDPGDTPEDLRRFRTQQQIPIAWTVAKAVHKGDERVLLDSVNYRFGQAGNHWTHPNAIIALRPNGTPAKMLIGTTYDIDDALAAARGGHDLVGRYGGWMLGVLLLVCLSSLIYLMTLIGTRGDGSRGGAENAEKAA